MALFIGFIFGIISSFFAAILYDKITRPKLAAAPDSSRAQGQADGQAPHEFYHLVVRNVPARFLGGRRAAWDCKVTIEVVDLEGERLLPEIIWGRWASQPEPVVPVSTSNVGTGALDFGRLILGRKATIYSHENHSVSIAIKFEGSPDCYIFSNESYIHNRWENPAWKLGPGSHRLRVQFYYERPSKPVYYRLHNNGTSRNDLALTPE
jgi:hypothetical protein